MRRISWSLAIVGLASVLNASQQPSTPAIGRPSFLGHWTHAAADGVNEVIVEGRGNSPTGHLLVGTVPTALVISQQGTTLIVEEHRQFIVTVNRVEHGLNGEPINTSFVLEPPRSAAPAEVTSKWQANSLVSTIIVLVPGEVPGESDPRRYVETMSISPEGILAVKIQRVGATDSRTVFYRKAK